MRIGVLTGGGDCPGLNAVIRAVVKTAIHQYNDEVVGIKDGFSGLIHNHTFALDLDKVSGIMPRGGTILGSSNRDNPFAFSQTVDGKRVEKDVSSVVVDNYNLNKLDCLIVIGGDGTLDIAHKLSAKGLKIIGIPKTIDNDLSATDTTFGHDTAIGTVMDALDKIHTTAESHHRVMVVEVMGRDAGWISIAAGIAGGGHIILIPEIPFEIGKIAETIYQRKARGKHFTVVVVAEGATPKGGDRTIKRIVEESSEKVRLGGVGEMVARELESITGLEARTTVLGHIQRGGSPSAFDRILATRYGASAVFHAHEGDYDHMVALRTPEIVAIPLEKALHQMKRVPLEGSHVVTARRVGISFGD
ncbi:MAG: 6-phosphofructokinase [Nitrospinota bacterium]|nr:6-phosphofructokinase [Nitrospinota bacterium]MDH5756668.1 6-phosphofructokinase [Nitrospinota bacterium]